MPAVVEGLLDMHFYDFMFQREVIAENHNKNRMEHLDKDI